MIVPTVGRMVWFFQSGRSLAKGDQPQAATIAYVWDDTCVNLGVLGPTGSAEHYPPRIRLLQDDETAPEDGNYCMWMPYQIGQAAKAEALEQQLDEKPEAKPEAAQQQVSENAA